MTTTDLTPQRARPTEDLPRGAPRRWAVTARRGSRWSAAANTLFDVIILGGGINGACLYDRLASRGHTVCLLDEHDFAAGTSQASGMMIWGGLLYLRNRPSPTSVETSDTVRGTSKGSMARRARRHFTD